MHKKYLLQSILICRFGRQKQSNERQIYSFSIWAKAESLILNCLSYNTFHTFQYVNK